jgi:DNA-binding CsgD family transcriptional regulator
MARTYVAAGPLLDLMRALTASPPPRPLDQPVAVRLSVLAAFGRLIPADEVNFSDLAPQRRSFWTGLSTLPDGDQLDDPDALEVFYRHFWSAPCSHPDRSGDRESVTTLSDFYTLRAWRRSPMYLEYIRSGFPFDRELLLPLPGPPGHSRRILFHRQRGRDFDNTDRALAALVRPHLVAYLHALDLASRGIIPLTTRQRQLLALVSDGFSNLQVARTLGISVHTVRTHLQQIYTRLGVTSRTEAAALVRPPR